MLNVCWRVLCHIKMKVGLHCNLLVRCVGVENSLLGPTIIKCKCLSPEVKSNSCNVVFHKGYG